jgi:hypothetical protein
LSLKEYFDLPEGYSIDEDSWIPMIIFFLVVFQDLSKSGGDAYSSLRIRDKIRVKVEKE